jgi:hypothetical protein
MALPFSITGPPGGRIVRIDHGLGADTTLGRLTLRTCANRPARLVADQWPAYLAESVDLRQGSRQGQAKGRVLTIWRDLRGRPAAPLAVCCWHVHEGIWPLAVLDAGAATAVGRELGAELCAVLFAALAELAAHPKFADRKAPRPADRVLWRVDAAEPGPELHRRPARARELARRGQEDHGAVRIARKDRPSWAQSGFLGRIDVEGG